MTFLENPTGFVDCYLGRSAIEDGSILKARIAHSSERNKNRENQSVSSIIALGPHVSCD